MFISVAILEVNVANTGYSNNDHTGFLILKIGG